MLKQIFICLPTYILGFSLVFRYIFRNLNIIWSFPENLINKLAGPKMVTSTGAYLIRVVDGAAQFSDS